MKLINNIFKIILILSFSFADECRLIEVHEECLDTEGCEWNEELNFCQSSNDGNDWEDDCEGLSEEDCEWLDYCVWDDEGDACYRFEDGEEEDLDCDELGQEDCYEIDYCQWTDEGCVFVDDDEDDWEDDCEGLSEEDCEWLDYCDWMYNNNLPEGGFCTEADFDEEDGPPECVMDCEGIDSVDPEGNPFGFCEWLVNLDDSCFSDCDDETLEEIIEFYNFCEDCLEMNNCDEDWEEDLDCDELGEEDCYETEGCEWVENPNGNWGECHSSDDNNWDCEELGQEDCYEIDYCQWTDEGCIFADDDWDNDCEDLNEDDCYETEGCEWVESPNGNWGECHSSDDDNWDCEELGQEDCYEIDYCQWTDEGCSDLNDDSEGNGLIKLDSVFSQPGSMVEINIYMESNTDVAGFQFSVIDQPNWLTGLEIDSHINCFEANINDVDGYLIAIMFSFEGCSIDPTDGLNVATIYYNLSDAAEYGENIELIMDDLIVSDINGDALEFDQISGNVMVGSFPGDVNQDGELNILDIVQTINFILLISNPTESEFISADINEDGSLDILDVVGIINLIL